MDTNLQDTKTFKWQYGDKLYCALIHSDDDPMDPRENFNIATMACWHNRYELGDDVVGSDTPELFWERLVHETLSDKEVLEATWAGRLPHFQLRHNKKDPSLTDVYREAASVDETEWTLGAAGLNEDELIDLLWDEMTVCHFMALMKPYAEWRPLWLYDHGSISISCGQAPNTDKWDTSQVGWILVLKDTILGEMGANFKSSEEAEAKWRDTAREVMKSEVEEYNQYLQGEAYGFTLYEAAISKKGPPRWQETNDECYGFLGDDLVKTGMADDIGYGLKEALDADKVTTGMAVVQTTISYLL